MGAWEPIVKINKPHQLIFWGAWMLSLSLLFSGCAKKTSPPPPQADLGPEPSTVPLRTVEKFQAVLDGGLVLDYQVEQKMSRVNSKACFAYITGVLYNRSKEAISKKTALDVSVFGKNGRLFRDQSYPVADLQPGSGAAIEMVISPVHSDGCPKYEKITIIARKVPL